MLGNFVVTCPAPGPLAGGFRTEFFIKTGLVLLGASINLKVLVTAAGPAIIQALLLISIVFGFTWWLGGQARARGQAARAAGVGRVDLRCQRRDRGRGRGAGQAGTARLRRILVITFALPSIFLLPWLAGVFGLSDAVAGAWIGGNIDTTAAVDRGRGASPARTPCRSRPSSRSPRTR